jgi:hypothetical protein
MFETDDQLCPASRQGGNDREASAYVTPYSLLRHEGDACFVLEPMFWPAAPPEARLDINDPMLLEVSLHLPVTSSVTTAGGSGMDVTRAAPDSATDLATSWSEDIEGPPTYLTTPYTPD